MDDALTRSGRREAGMSRDKYQRPAFLEAPGGAGRA